MAEIEVSTNFMNPGGYIKVFPPKSVLPVAELAGNTLGFNPDFSAAYLPKPYVKVRKLHRVPIKASGMSFFTNFLPEVDIASLSVEVRFSETLVLDSGASVAVDVIPTDTTNKFYVTVAPGGSVPNFSELILAFHDGTNYIGFSPLLVKVPEDFEAVVNLSYRSDRNGLSNFPYLWDEDGRSNEVCVFGSMGGVEYPEELQVYKAVTTGRSHKANALLERQIVFETYYLDFFAHEGVAVAFHHDDVKINGRTYVSVEAYNPNYLVDKDLTKGVITLTDVAFSQRYTICP